MKCQRWHGMMRFWFIRYLISLDDRSETKDLLAPCGELKVFKEIDLEKWSSLEGRCIVVGRRYISKCSVCGALKVDKV